MALKQAIRDGIKQQRPGISNKTLVRYTNAIHNIYTTLDITERRLRQSDIQQYFTQKVETSDDSINYLRYLQAVVNAIFFPNNFVRFLPPRLKKRRAQGGLRNSYQRGVLTEQLVLRFFNDITNLYETTSNDSYYYTCLLVFLMITMGIRAATIREQLTLGQIKNILNGCSVRNQIYIYKSSVVISRSIVKQLSDLLVLESGFCVREWLSNNLVVRGEGDYHIPSFDLYKILNQFPYLRTEGRISTYGIRDGQPKDGYGFGFHEYRRFAATKLYELTNNISLVQHFLVHASPNITNKYLKPHIE